MFHLASKKRGRLTGRPPSCAWHLCRAYARSNHAASADQRGVVANIGTECRRRRTCVLSGQQHPRCIEGGGIGISGACEMRFPTQLPATTVLSSGGSGSCCAPHKPEFVQPLLAFDRSRLRSRPHFRRPPDHSMGLRTRLTAVRPACHKGAASSTSILVRLAFHLRNSFDGDHMSRQLVEGRPHRSVLRRTLAKGFVLADLNVRDRVDLPQRTTGRMSAGVRLGALAGKM